MPRPPSNGFGRGEFDGGDAESIEVLVALEESVEDAESDPDAATELDFVVAFAVECDFAELLEELEGLTST